MTEEKCMRRIYKGYSAKELLLERFPDAEAEFNTSIRRLNELIARIKTYFPDANLYLQEDSMCLMLGSSHNESGPQMDLVALEKHMPDAGGGAW